MPHSACDNDRNSKGLQVVPSVPQGTPRHAAPAERKLLPPRVGFVEIQARRLRSGVCGSHTLGESRSVGVPEGVHLEGAARCGRSCGLPDGAGELDIARCLDGQLGEGFLLLRHVYRCRALGAGAVVLLLGTSENDAGLWCFCGPRSVCRCSGPAIARGAVWYGLPVWCWDRHPEILQHLEYQPSALGDHHRHLGVQSMHTRSTCLGVSSTNVLVQAA
mmetsp:Transcript_8175/g.20327  ORF Transcript_8175/g.20327 Transcript_8175/m.20327 type:complete len:218 (-) Transcript_8175:975-1628(-)